MKYCLGAVVALLLAACTSVSTLRDAPASLSIAGTDSVENVASCIHDAWSTKPLRLETIVLYTGTSIQLRQGDKGPVLALVDLKPLGGRTTATYFSRLEDDDSWYIGQVQRCMGPAAG